MKINDRQELKRKIIEGNNLFTLQGSRLKRVFKDPVKTIPYFIINVLSKLHPFKISYKTLWGDTMKFYLPEGNAIYYYGFFEPGLTNFFINSLKNSDIFFDVGAHVGYYSLLSSELVGNTGKIHSFEPTPRTFLTLKENVSLKKNVTVNNCAVMDTEDEIEFIDYGPKYSAFNSFRNRDNEETMLTKPNTVRTKTISLDHYCAVRNIVPTIIKIDAEGAEHIILKSMHHILSKHRPIITIEVAGGEEWKENCALSIEHLLNRGYCAYEITIEGYLLPHIPRETYLYENLVFIHSEKVSEYSNLIKK